MTTMSTGERSAESSPPSTWEAFSNTFRHSYRRTRFAFSPFTDLELNPDQAIHNAKCATHAFTVLALALYPLSRICPLLLVIVRAFLWLTVINYCKSSGWGSKLGQEIKKLGKKKIAHSPNS